MKVGVVTTSYPRFPDDPAGNFVGEHVRFLRELGHEVEVIAAADDGSPTDDEVMRVPSGGLFYRGGAPDLLERTPKRLVSAAMFSARLAASIARRAHRWDSIVAHWLAPSALACLVAAPRTPLLAIAHGGDVHTLRRLRLLAPALHLLRALDAQLVFVSEELRAIAIGASPRLSSWLSNARVQPMGIDLARFAEIPRAQTVNTAAMPTIVIVSRLVPIKGVDIAIAAMAHIRHRVRLVIAGDGPEKASLIQAAHAHGAVIDRGGPRATTEIDANKNGVRILTKSGVTYRGVRSEIEFFGAIDTRARDRLLATANIALVPSRTIGTRGGGRTEGTPLIALEALAAGIPVIASDVGGLRNLDIVRVPPDDPRALAQAIDRVLDAPPSASELRDRVAHLDWRHVVGSLVRNR